MALTTATLQAAITTALQTNSSKNSLAAAAIAENAGAIAAAIAAPVVEHVTEYGNTTVATTAALTAIAAADRTDGLLVLVTADGSLWRFSSASTATASFLCLAPDAGTGRWLAVLPRYNTLYARGVVIADVADLAAFTVANNDGLTYAEGQRVLLANQTTAAQCGLYVVGVVATGTAPLVRAPEMPVGATVVNGQVVHVSEGTLWKGSAWKAMCTGAAVVATNDPIFYPQNCRGTLTLASGTKALGATEGLFLLSTTRSSWSLSFNTEGGTKTGTVGFKCAVGGRTAGKSGTGAATVIAHIEAGSIQNQDNSTVDWTVTNW